MQKKGAHTLVAVCLWSVWGCAPVSVDPQLSKEEFCCEQNSPVPQGSPPGGAVGVGDKAGWSRQGKGRGPAGPSMVDVSDAASALGSPFALNVFTIHKNSSDSASK